MPRTATARRQTREVDLTDRSEKLDNPLVDATIVAARAAKVRVEIRDTKERDLSVRVGPRGAKYRFRYRFDGQRFSHPLGDHGEGFKVADARRAAAKARSEVDDGRHPFAEKRKEKAIKVAKNTGATVRELGEKWTTGKLLEQYGEVHGLREKASADDDRKRLELYVYPYIGDAPVASITEEEIERTMAMAERDAKVRRKGVPLRPATKFQLYQVMRRLFQLAVRPVRLRSDNPVSAGLRPKVKADDKVFSWLHPDEMVRLLRCAEIPAGRRALYAAAVYTGLRRGSLLALKWADIDFKHTTIRVLKTKNGIPQLFAQRDELVPGLESVLVLLRRWQTLCGRRSGLVWTHADLGSCEMERMAGRLRDDLRAAGIDRAELFGGDPKIEPLRFHDLRATFTTWARRAGKGDGWISDRTGHLTPAMLNRYNRAARLLQDLGIEPFPDVADCLDAKADNVVSLPRAR